MMRKKILAVLAGAMLVSSIAFAAPVTDLQKGQTSLGLDVSSLRPTVTAGGASADLGSNNAYTFFVQHKVADGVVLGLESGKFDASYSGFDFNLKATDVYAQYEVYKNVNFLAGIRDYDTSAGYAGISLSSSESKFLWGLSASADLGGSFTGYAAYKGTAYEREWQVGVTSQIAKDVVLDLSYKNHDYGLGAGASLKLSGVGLGLSCKF